jgi:hypothetical protein
VKENHRSVHKIAVLLFLQGYPIEAAVLRRAVTHGLDYLDHKIARYRQPGVDNEAVARRVARAIVATPARTDREKKVRQARKQAGAKREDEIAAYTRLLLVYIGGTVGPTSIATSVATLAPTVRTTPDYLAMATTPGGAMDRDLAEIAARDGFGAAARQAVPAMRTADFARARAFIGGALAFADANNHDLGMPTEGFVRDCYTALSGLPPNAPSVL